MNRLILLTAALCGLSVPASAQDVPTFASNTFEPFPILKKNLLGVARSETLEHMGMSAGLLFHYADAPLVLAQPDGSSLELVEFQAMGEIWFGVGVMDFMEFGLVLPVTFLQEGGDLDQAADDTDATVATIADPRLVAKFRLLNAEDAFGFGAAVAATAFIPSGDETSFNSDGSFRFEPRLVLDWSHPVGLALTTNLGYQVRPERQQFGYVSDDQIRYAAGLLVPTGLEGLRLYGTLFGALQTTGDGPQWGKGPGEPAEAHGGLQWDSKQGVTLSIGGGPGLNDAVSAPKYRAILAFGYTPPDDDKDDDGIKDRYDRCPLEPEDFDDDRDTDGCPDDDRDQDRIVDSKDQCPAEREDVDGFEDEDGCPDPDNDADGVPDKQDLCPLEPGKGQKDGCPRHDSDKDGIPNDADRCPDQPEDKDGFDDEDGCPDEDNDFDGVPDKQDRCPLKSEDRDGYQDEDGCPDEDNDRDGIPDSLDQCPDQAETLNDVDDTDGCPDTANTRVKVTKDRIVITQKVFFANNSDRIEARSFDILDEVAQTLNDHPEIPKIVVEGHTDDRGKYDANVSLSQRRAASVVRYLVSQGVDETRLDAQGFGPDRPIESNETAEGRDNNRRVEFVIAR